MYDNLNVLLAKDSVVQHTYVDVYVRQIDAKTCFTVRFVVFRYRVRTAVVLTTTQQYMSSNLCTHLFPVQCVCVSYLLRQKASITSWLVVSAHGGVSERPFVS